MQPRGGWNGGAWAVRAGRGTARIVDSLAAWAEGAAPSRLSLAAALVALMMCLPGFFSIPPVDRDEARFAQATKQMMETSDYIDIRLQDEVRYKKPVGIYWLQAAAAKGSTFGADAPIWVYRIPSLLGIVASAALATWLAGLFFGGVGALMVGVLVASAILPGVEARLAKSDAVLLACILAFHIGIARAWLSRKGADGPRLGVLGLSWLAMGLGILVKGPIAPMVAGLTVVALAVTSREARWIGALRPLPGLALALLVAAPWYVAIGLKTDGAFFGMAAGQDLLGKALSGQESHGAPPGVHVLASIGTFWPLSALFLLAIPHVRGALRRPAIVFALCWAVPTGIVFELVPTKLPHYVLPVLPAVALLVVAVLRGRPESPRWAERASALLLVLVPAALCLALFAAAIYLRSPRLAAGAIVLAGACAVAWPRRDRGPWRRTVRYASAAFLVYLGTYPFGLAGFAPVWVSPALADAAERVAPCKKPTIFLAGFREPSAVFLLGTQTRLVDGTGAATGLLAGGCSIAIVESRQAEAFRSGAPLAIERAHVEGLNLNGGDALRFDLYTEAP